MTKAAELAKIGEVLTNSQIGGRRNLIINGAVSVNQRNVGTVNVNATNNGYTTADRWQANRTADDKYSIQVSTDAPDNFNSSLLATSLSAYSVSASDIFFLQQSIEGNNCVNLAWGSSAAETITLSFYVKSSLTGTFGGCLANSAHNRSYPFSYSISSANTWERKTLTITGDTSGTWLTDNSTGVQVIFGLGGGSTRSGTAGAWNSNTNYTATGATSLVGTSGATWQITGVQFEIGKDTPFEHRSFGEELALCQRYYYQSWGSGAWASNIGPGYAGQVLPAANNASSQGTCSFPVAMRAAPTVTTYDGLGASGTVTQPAIANGIAATAGSISVSGFFSVTKDSGTFTVGTPVIGQFKASIEL